MPNKRIHVTLSQMHTSANAEFYMPFQTYEPINFWTAILQVISADPPSSRHATPVLNFADTSLLPRANQEPRMNMGDGRHFMAILVTVWLTAVQPSNKYSHKAVLENLDQGCILMEKRVLYVHPSLDDVSLYCRTSTIKVWDVYEEKDLAKWMNCAAFDCNMQACLWTTPRNLLLCLSLKSLKLNSYLTDASERNVWRA
ncbi:hypothetical protein ARMGADRAFT_1037783 [Armillaria gallica]|uniref:Uncharacterized protein n=1 Tax=Armillaria gallica TaxID=47427 RepID=A0A2H3CKQ6_ARMGA|nr:hypothetical protein ARMGADRAFT_1037783 [Armillaria gallica]